MFEVGKEYRCNKGDKFTCIAIVGEFAYLTSGQCYAAYTWHMDGRSHSLSHGGDEYDIPPEVKWVTEDAHYDTEAGLIFNYRSGQFPESEHNFRVCFPIVNGKPDWDQCRIWGIE